MLSDSEEPPDGRVAGRGRSIWRRRLPPVAVIVVVVLVLALLWQYYWRPLTLQETMEEVEWSPGDVRTLEETITGVEILNTTYGPFAALSLHGQPCEWAVLEDLTRDWNVGEIHRVEMHFDTFRVNGVEGVWTPQLACPIPALPLVNSLVTEGLSYSLGMGLVFNGTDDSGWVSYSIRSLSGERVELNRTSASLASGRVRWENSTPDVEFAGAPAWIVWSAIEYVHLTGAFVGAEIDSMAALSESRSEGGRLRFTDSDGDGLLGDGDRLEVLLPPTQDSTDYETYYLTLGDPAGTGNASALRYIVVGEQGPFEIVA